MGQHSTFENQDNDVLLTNVWGILLKYVVMQQVNMPLSNNLLAINSKYIIFWTFFDMMLSKHYI